MPGFKNITGLRFGRLLVLDRADNKNKQVCWNCLCDCGNTKVVSANHLQQNHVKSCGCALEEARIQTAKKNFTKHGLTNTDEYDLLQRARYRAKRDGVRFALSITDIQIPNLCPVLGIKLLRHKGIGGFGQPDSPSLDRLIPSKGYVPSNVRVISNKANAIKNQASADELMKVAKWLKKELQDD